MCDVEKEKQDQQGQFLLVFFLGIHLEYKEYYRFYSCLRALSIIFCESNVLIFRPSRSSWTALNTQGSLLHLHAPTLKPPWSRSLLPMFSVNEEAAIVCEESWRGDVISKPRWRPLFLLCCCIFSPPWNRKLTLALPGSEERGVGWEGVMGGGGLHRKTQSGSGLSFLQ